MILPVVVAGLVAGGPQQLVTGYTANNPVHLATDSGLGPVCDLAACTCDTVDLTAQQQLGVVTTPTNTDGYIFMLSFCSDIPVDALPSGCQSATDRSDHPAVVKYKANNASDCIEVGSNGCTDAGFGRSCGMSGEKTPGGVDITWAYQFGQRDTFRLSLTTGEAAAPGKVVSAWAVDNSSSWDGGDYLSYTASWAVLGEGKPAACSVSDCVCDGVDLSALEGGGTYHTPPDAQNYSFMFSICAEIPLKSLPAGCKTFASRPTAVKYLLHKPADCMEVGSLAGPVSRPCDAPGAKDCGMFGTKTTEGVRVTYEYQSAKENAFEISLTHGTEANPKYPVEEDCNEYRCTYVVSWAGLAKPEPGPGSPHTQPDTTTTVLLCVGGTLIQELLLRSDCCTPLIRQLFVRLLIDYNCVLSDTVGGSCGARRRRARACAHATQMLV